MKSFETYKCRRQALGMTREQLAEKANVDVKLIECFEEGLKIDSISYDKIRRVIYYGFKNIDSVEHYKKRILELALELQIEDNTQHALTEIGHMIVELGKWQMAMVQ